ncbi:MAG: tetratricopeptide repeat protein [Armatimonadota bacterium]|nr:tetratricopeptide repeat protein [Armatimonadota bacterium]
MRQLGRHREERLRRAVLGPKPGPGPDCPDDLTVFHAAAGLLSSEEMQAFERHLEGCLACRDRELETRKLLHFEQHRIPYRIDPDSGRVHRVSDLAFLRSALHPRVILRRLTDLAPKRLAVALASLLVAALAWSLASPALARSPAVLAAAKQVPVVRWLLPASVREYLEATLLLDRLSTVPAADRVRWGQLARRVESHLLRAVRLDPSLADAHFVLGQLYAERYYRLRDPGALRKAEVHYLRAIALRPDHLEARYRLADDVYSAQGRWDRELEQYDAILRADPTHLDARWARGWVHLERGEVGLAVRDFRQVLAQDPRDFESLWAIGIAQALSGRMEELARTLEELRRVNPGRAQLLERLIRAGGRSR